MPALHRLPDAIRTEVLARRTLLENGDDLVVDGDAHVTDLAALPPPLAARLASSPDYFHGRPVSAEQMLAEMDLAQVDLALIWQNPFATARDGTAEANKRALLAANAYVQDAARRWPRRFIPAGWTDPSALGLERALEVVEQAIAQAGCLAVKMNPAQNRFPIDHPHVFSLVDRILALGGIPAFHVGGDTPFTPASGLERVARHCAPRPIIAVHMGGGGSSYTEGETLYQEIRALGLRCSNLFFIQSAKRDCHIESDFIAYELAGGPHPHQIAVGSDAPYGRLSWNFGGYRSLFASLRDPRHPDPRLRRNPGLFVGRAEARYLGANLIRLLRNGYAAWPP